MALGGCRVVEPDHEAVAGEVLERAAESHDLFAHRALIRTQQRERLLRLGRLAERREPSEIAEDDRDLATVPRQQGLAVGRRNDRGDLRGKVAGELALLTLDRVVVLLDPKERPHADGELVLRDRLRDEVVGAGLERPHPVLLHARGHQHDRQETRVRARAKAPGQLVAVHPGHEDVQQHEVRRALGDGAKSFVAGGRGHDLVPVPRQEGFE